MILGYMAMKIIQAFRVWMLVLLFLKTNI